MSESSNGEKEEEERNRGYGKKCAGFESAKEKKVEKAGFIGVCTKNPPQSSLPFLSLSGNWQLLI